MARRYLVTETRAVTVTADTPAEAQAKGVELLDGGFGEVVAVEVEPLRIREENA